jgi:hypothetical protein
MTYPQDTPEAKVLKSLINKMEASLYYSHAFPCNRNELRELLEIARIKLTKLSELV